MEGAAQKLWQRQRHSPLFSAMAAARIFVWLWRAGLVKYYDMAGIAWKWQSLDGTQGIAPLAQ
jgi:hypothetical protein